MTSVYLSIAKNSSLAVAIGYQDEHGAWATEGWWNIAAQSCETLLKGGLPGRYIYVHAVDYDRGGEWTGPRIMCTAEKMFLLRDGADCGQRGQRKSGFYEVDVGTAKDWTIRLSQSDEARQR